MEMIKRDFNRMSVMLIPIAVAVNFIAGSLVHSLKLPIYMDMIGTFFVGMIGGPWIGMVTGVLSILLKGLTDPAEIPFSLLSGILGLMTGLLAQRRMFTNLSKTVISGIILAAVAVIMSIVIRVSFYGGYSTGGTSNLIAAMVAAGIPFWPAQFMGQMVSEIPDKIISVIFAYMIIQNMSARYKIKFPMGRLYVEG